MEEFTMLSWGLGAKTLTFCVAAVSVHYMLRFYDHKNEVNWVTNHDLFQKSAMAAAVYFGARILAVTMLAGAVYS